MSKSKNRELFNEAIADAKAIKEMAIENAKKAIAESFTPQIHKMLATKLEEMENEELEETELTNEEVESTNENEIDEAKKKADDEEETTSENVNLDELLAELNEDETNEEESLNEELETEAKKAEDKKDSKEDDNEEEEEEIDLESMSPEDLEDFIKGVIKDMTSSGELGNEEGSEEGEDEDISIDEIMKSLGENEELEEGGSTFKPVNKKAVDAKSVEYYEKNVEKVKEELGEAIATINEMKKTLSETNLLNAKLLYTNKIFKAKNLNESQKVKVLNSFDEAKTVSESKVVYNLLMESLGEKKTQIKEHRSTASAVISGTNKGTKKPILENVDPQITRFMKLAGISN